MHEQRSFLRSFQIRNSNTDVRRSIPCGLKTDVLWIVLSWWFLSKMLIDWIFSLTNYFQKRILIASLFTVQISFFWKMSMLFPLRKWISAVYEHPLYEETTNCKRVAMAEILRYTTLALKGYPSTVFPPNIFLAWDYNFASLKISFRKFLQSTF